MTVAMKATRIEARRLKKAKKKKPATLLEGISLTGEVNTADEVLARQIAHSIRLGYPQIKTQPFQPDRVAIVGGGPSLEKTEGELRDLYFAGTKIVALNNAYRWCLDHGYRPSAHILLDARASNARFIGPPVPKCRYLLASQCHPETWAAVAGREDVWIWHSAYAERGLRKVLDDYYLKRWLGISGGTTVAMRAIWLLRTLGFLRMDLFGIDSCWMGEAHHAFPQTENEADRRYKFNVHPTGHEEQGRVFTCSPWHVQQLDDLLQMVRLNGEQFLLNIHGDGLLAHALKSVADITYTKVEG